jgi:predicted nuclease with TOPRIM domain
VESTADLIRETEELERRLLEERRILEETKRQKERLLSSLSERESRLSEEAVRFPEPHISQPQVSDKGRQSPIVTDKPPMSEGSWKFISKRFEC